MYDYFVNSYSRETETVKKEQYFSHIMTVILYLAQMKAACLEKGKLMS